MRIRAFVALALCSCAAFVGLDPPAFDAPTDAGVEAAPAEAGVDAPPGAPADAAATRLRDITFEDGLTGGMFGATKAHPSVVLTMPGLRGNGAARCTDAGPSFVTYELQHDEDELFVTFRARIDELDAAVVGQPTLARFVSAAQDLLGGFGLDASGHVFAFLGGMRSMPNPSAPAMNSDGRVGLHVKRGTPGLLEIWIAGPNEAFGEPFATLTDDVLVAVHEIKVGSSVDETPTPFTSYVVDDIIVDRAALIIPPP